MSIPIALQLYTVRDVLDADLAAGLAQVAQIGYECVELASLNGYAPREVRQMCIDTGLRIVAWHSPVEGLEDGLDSLMLETDALGCRYVVIPHIPPAMRSRRGYSELAATLNRAGRTLAEAGQSLCYHHHAFEWEALPPNTGNFDDARGIDILVNQTDPAYVNIELDLYWAQFAGDDPLTWLDRLAGRVPLVHVKDMAQTPDRHFTEVGTGTVDIAAAVVQAPRSQVEYLIVEQDGFWMNDDPMASAKLSLMNLRKLRG